MTAPMTLRSRGRRARVSGDDPNRVGDTGYQIGRFQDAADEATLAAADQGREDFGREVGARLGGLAGIGALRSGATSAGIAEAGRTYSQNVSRAAAGNAIQAAGLGQREAADQRDLGFRGRELDSRVSEGALDRGSREKLSGDDLAFRREDLAERSSQFGQDLGFRREGATEQSRQFGEELGFRGREGEATRAGQLNIATLDVASREKLASMELEFRRQGLSSEEARAAAELEFRKSSFGEDLGFRREGAAEQSRQFGEDLGFRRQESGSRADLERQRMAEERRQFDVQRADAEKAAKAKKKGGLFGFIGKALGVASNFIPGGSIARGLVKAGIRSIP